MYRSLHLLMCLACTSLLSIILSFSFASSQDNPLPENIDEPMGVTAGLTNIEVSFCNSNNTSESSGHFATTIAQGELYDLCIELFNKNTSDIQLNVGFVDGSYTVDSTQKRSCKGNEFVERFGQYVSNYDQTIVVPAQSMIQETVRIELPDDHAGSVRGCMVFSLNPNHTKDREGLFDVVVRKAHFIDLYVDGPVQSSLGLQEPLGISTIDDLSKNGDIYIHRLPQGGIEFVVGLVNDGDIDQSTESTLRISNALGMTIKEIDISKKIMAHQAENIRFKLEDIPRYKGYFFVDMLTSYGSDAETQQETQTVTLTSSFFLFPGRLIAILIGVFVVFHLIIGLNKKSTQHSDKKVDTEDPQHHKKKK